jgi:hypothetical protein
MGCRPFAKKCSLAGGFRFSLTKPDRNGEQGYRRLLSSIGDRAVSREIAAGVAG